MNIFEKVKNEILKIQNVSVLFGRVAYADKENIAVLKCGESYKESEYYQGGNVKPHESMVISVCNGDFLRGYNAFESIKNMLNEKVGELGLVHYKDLGSSYNIENGKHVFDAVYKII